MTTLDRTFGFTFYRSEHAATIRMQSRAEYVWSAVFPFFVSSICHAIPFVVLMVALWILETFR